MPYFSAVVFVLGVCAGSFLNVLIDRLPKGETVTRGRSHCDHCKKTPRWYELIPLISYLVQGGRCRRCRKPLSAAYPVTELVTGIGFAAVFWATGGTESLTALVPLLRLTGSLIIFSSLLVITGADLKYYIIPDVMVISGFAGAGLMVLPAADPVNLMTRVFTGLAAGTFFYALRAITRGRGMGLGDVKLALLMGFLTGYPGIVMALYAAFLTGALVSVILVIGGRHSLQSIVPFGPFLILGTASALIWHQAFLIWWKGFIP